MAAEKITIYQKPTCSTCRSVYKALVEMKVDFDVVDYYIEPLSKARLKSLLKKMGAQAKDIIRTKEPIYKELGIASKELSNDDLIDLMVQYPDLIQRPIVEKGERAILARPAERLKELF